MKIFNLICFLFIISIFCTIASAEDILKMHVIDASPIGFYDEQKNPTGYHWDYMTEIQKRSGIPMKLILIPYSRIWQSLENGDHDGGIVYRSPDRDSIVVYAAPVAERKNVVISQKGIILNSYNDLYKLKSIATMRGVRLGDEFDADPNIIKILKSVYDYDTIVNMLIHGRYDAMAGNSVTMSYLLNKYNGVNEVELPGIVVGKRVEWLQFSKKSRHLDKIPKLKETIEELKNEGFFDKVLEKYIGKKLIKVIQ